ncbi:NAD(P)-binding protein [Aureobasidium pullulans]|nr:NAD(P)-binding protein [Aureobasidium pullulans]
MSIDPDSSFQPCSYITGNWKTETHHNQHSSQSDTAIMKVAITGAGGFVGQLLAEHLLNADHEVTLIDIFEPPIPQKASSKSSTATCIKADLYSDSASVIPSDLDAIFIFHGIMSAGSEADFDLGYRVNLHSTLNLLETLRQKTPGVKVVYASSTAIYGNPLPQWPSEKTLPTPSSSYGTQKTMIEYAINDFSRRGYINGFILRFPTISVRPGKPTQAASSWMSGMFREPLQGLESSLPCADDFEAWLCSPRVLVENLLHVLTLERECMPSHTRQINLPGITASVKEMLEALRQVGGEKAVSLVKREEPSKEIKDMLDSWPIRFDVSKALSLGFKRDEKFVDAVEDFARSLKE